MKLVHIIATLSTGGAQTMLLRLLERLDQRFTSHVISLSTLGAMGPRMQALGVPVEGLGMKPGVPSPSALLSLISRLKHLRPDIVHTWMYHADLMGGLAARQAGIPGVIWSIRHGNLDADKNKYSTLAVMKMCALLSESVPVKIVSNSQQACRVHAAQGYAERKMVVIPNGFDLSIFRPNDAAKRSVRSELEIPEDRPIVGWVGRYHSQKNVEGFFQAAGRIHSRIPDAFFVLAGEGLETSNSAVAQAMELAGVAGHMRLLGIRTDIPRLMSAMDVFVSSSSGEAFPNVVGEAMACGVPCVVTDVGDSAYVAGDTGRVAKPEDTAALARAVEELLSLSHNERAALGSQARKRIAGHFEIGGVVRRYETLYDEVKRCVE